MNLKLSVFSIFSLLLFFSVSCANEQDPILIGATMSQSGSYATQGVAAKNGYMLCEQHINEQGGVLGRNIEFLIYDDESSSERAIELYEKLITEDQVDAIMGPYGSTLTEAVAPVTERHRMVQISPLAATTSIWEQGREYLFMVLPPAELFLAGLIDMASDNDLSRIAILQEDQLFPKAAGEGASELALEHGMQVTMHETYPSGTEDFREYLEQLEQNGTEVLAMAASALDDFIKVVQQMEELNVNVKMFGSSGAVQQFYDELGEKAEYAYGLSAWEPSVDNPGIDHFTNSYRETYNIEPSFHAAGGYGSCQLFVEAIEKAGTLNSDEIRNVLLELETQTIFSNYAVDERGYQTANSGLFIQWQDGNKEIVWPEEAATSAPRFPTPPWSER